jgi:hypothetical protein
LSPWRSDDPEVDSVPCLRLSVVNRCSTRLKAAGAAALVTHRRLYESILAELRPKLPDLRIVFVTDLKPGEPADPGVRPFPGAMAAAGWGRPSPRGKSNSLTPCPATAPEKSCGGPCGRRNRQRDDDP